MSETADSHRNSQQHQEENFILPVVIAVAVAIAVVVVRSSDNNSSTLPETNIFARKIRPGPK